jgi:hypothetical protein
MIDFPALHPDLLDEDVIKNFAETNEIVLDTHILTAEKDIYGIDLYTEPGGTLETNIYYFRLTGVADGYTEQLLAENSIITGGTEKISIFPYIRLGRENPRITHLKLYFSTDDITYYKTKEYLVKKTNFDIASWKIDIFGRLILTAGTEFYIEGSAVSTINEQNSFGSWTEHNMDGTFEIDETEAALGGGYSFKVTVEPYGEVPPDSLRRGIKVPIDDLKLNTTYTVQCYLKMQLLDIFEDFEDTDYNLNTLWGPRVNTGTPIGSWHSFAEAHQNPYPTVFPFGAYAKIIADKPKKLEFYLNGGPVTVRKRFGNENINNMPALPATIVADAYGSKVTCEINDSRLGVEIYIIHEPDHFIVDEGMEVGVWLDSYMDNVTLTILSPNRSFYAFITGESLSTEGIFQEEIGNLSSEFEQHTFDVTTGSNETPLYFIFAHRPTEDDQTVFWLDEFSFKEKELVYFDTEDLGSPGTEMLAEMGYNPTYNMVKGWDQAMALRGRIYYLNPLVEKRYENFMLVSHIHSSGAYMWDIATFGNFRELERFDSSHAIGMELLSTTEIIILKDKSVEILNDDGTVGILREPILGVTCVARESIANILGTIFWCGFEEIYSFNTSKGVTPLLKNTIRNVYIALPDKHLIRGIRDRWHTYRIRVYDPVNKTEFLLTENGWIEEARFHFPVIYREDINAKINFMGTDGNIYGTLYELENLGYGKLYATRFGQRL